MSSKETVAKKLKEVIIEASYPDRPRGLMMPLDLVERTLALLVEQEQELHYRSPRQVKHTATIYNCCTCQTC